MSKKVSVNLRPDMSVQAIAAQARRAAAISIAERQLRKEAALRREAMRPEIERRMRSIHRAVNSTPLNNRVAVFERPGKMSSAYAVLNIYNAELYEIYLDALSSKKFGKHVKATKPKPEQSFVFYPTPADEKRLGSIAIYGDNLEHFATELMSIRFIFGMPLRSVQLKMGRRPFIDAHIRA